MRVPQHRTRFTLAVAAACVLLLAAPAFAQYGGASNLPWPASPAGSSSGESFRQSLSPLTSEKTASVVLAVRARMGERRAASPSALPLDWADLSTPLLRVSSSGDIQVYVILRDARPAFVPQLEALGLRVEATLGTTVQGWVPADALDAIAALDFVRLIRPPGYALHNQSGAADTAGNGTLRANEARVAFGVTGVGVPVGVISNGADHRALPVASGDLPPQGTIIRPGSGDEGTAMMEIIHDLAPGAPLLFWGSAGATSLEMVAGINALAGAGARVIVDDVTFFDQPKFQDGDVAQAARNFASGGRLYVSGANNLALRHYRAQFKPALSPVTIGGRSYVFQHDYAVKGPDVGNAFTLSAGCAVQVFLQWSNPWEAASDDFDLALVRASDGMVVASGQSVQSGSQPPYESLSYMSATTERLFVAIPAFNVTTQPSSSVTLDYFVIDTCKGNSPLLEHNVPEASVWGQGAVSEVLSVAAVNASNPSQVEPYSARGPGAIGFPSPETRSVPNITGADCVQTHIGQLGVFPGFPFCGTSAAAPHIAAIAALMIQRNPTLSSEQFRSILFNTAVDLGPPGYDFASGYGRADAFAAVQAVPPAPATVALAAAVLPSGRAGQVGAPATAFATIVALGTETAVGCAIVPLTGIPAAFSFQTTNPVTNALIGTPNTPVDIPAGSFQTFLVAFTPSGTFLSTDVAFSFGCVNSTPAPVISGVNTLLLSASATPGPDVVALVATVSNDGIVTVPVGSSGAFAVATVNVGATGQLTVSADTGGASLPLTVVVCQTNPVTAQCLGGPFPSVTATISAGSTPTFTVFVNASGSVPFNPAVNRIVVRFQDVNGVTRGSTSVAVRTQ